MTPTLVRWFPRWGRFFRRRCCRRPSPALPLPLLWRGGVCGGRRSAGRVTLLLPRVWLSPRASRKTLDYPAGFAESRPGHVGDVDGPLTAAGGCSLPIISCIGILARPLGDGDFGVLFAFSQSPKGRHLELIDLGLFVDLRVGRRHLASLVDPPFRLEFARKLVADPLSFGRTNPTVVVIHARMSRGRRVRGGSSIAPGGAVLFRRRRVDDVVGGGVKLQHSFVLLRRLLRFAARFWAWHCEMEFFSNWVSSIISKICRERTEKDGIKTD